MTNRSTSANERDRAAQISLAKSFRVGDRVQQINGKGLTGTVQEIDFRLATPQIWVVLDNLEGREFHPPLPYLPSDLVKIDSTLECQQIVDNPSDTDGSAIAPPTSFDYDALDSENAGVIKFHTEAIKQCIRRTAKDIIEIGERLTDVKEKLPHGQFGSWLQIEFNWDTRTAQRFMSVAAMFKSDTVSFLKSDMVSGFSSVDVDRIDIAPGALYLLAAKSTPKETRQEILERAYSDGESFTQAKVKEILKTRRSVKKPNIEQVVFKAGDVVLIKCDKDVEKEYRRWNGCWAFVQSVGRSNSSVKVAIGGQIMTFHKNDLRLIDSPGDDFQAVAKRVNELLERDDIDDFGRDVLHLYLRRQTFNKTALDVLASLWRRYTGTDDLQLDS